MRHAARSREIAELAVRYRDGGVVGFDIAGAEAGYPPTRHLDAFEYLRRENFHFTIHAGEAFGLPSIWEAIQWCGADRLGHGVRIIDDIRSTRTAGPGAAGAVRARQADPAGDVPDVQRADRRGRLDRRATRSACCAGCSFRVTVNTDNRLMSGTSMTREMALLVEAFGYGWADLQWFTINAMKSAFIPFDDRLEIINDSDQAGLRPACRLAQQAARLLGLAARSSASASTAALNAGSLCLGRDRRGHRLAAWVASTVSTIVPPAARNVTARWPIE